MGGHGASLGLSLDLALKSGAVFTYVRTDRALDLGNLAPLTIPDLSGNANTATQYTGIYVSTNGTTDKAIGADATALGSGNYYLSGKIKPAGTTAKTTMDGSTASNLTGLTAGVWQDFQTATASAITPSSINLGWDGTAFNATVDNWSDVKLHDASDDSVVAHWKLYDSADASLDGYPALDCVGGYHGANVGCAGGASEASILQTAGEDFNIGYPLSNDLTVDWVEAGVGVIVDSDTFTTPTSSAGVYLPIKTGITYNYKISGTTTGNFQIWDWGSGGALLKTIATGAFSAKGTFTSTGTSRQFYLRAQFGAIQVDLTELDLEIANYHVAESETTAGQDALGNAIENPRPNERVLNLTTGTGYAEVADSASLDLTTAATWELWGNFYGAIPTFQYILSKYRATGNERSWAILRQSGLADNSISVAFGFEASGLFAGRADWNALTDKVQQVVITNDGGSLLLYLDGALIGVQDTTSGTIPSTLYSGIAPVTIGALENGFAWNGQLGDIRIYDRVLTADEVLKNYQARRSAYGL